jgi:hypothetical protein
MLRRIALALSIALAFSLGVLSACEQRYSGDAPANSPSNEPGPASSAGLAAVLGSVPGDAGRVALRTEHAMVVTNCGWPSSPCAGLEQTDAEGGTYRVVFGSGRASIRSRGQAMSDLYRELRDKSSAGLRLDIEARAPSVGDAAAPPIAAPHASRGTASDPISQSAFAVLDLVDSVGEADVDEVNVSDADQCVISLGRMADGGAMQCLVRAPERAKRGPMGTGLSW